MEATNRPELYDYFLSKDSQMRCLFYFLVEEQLLLWLFDSEFQYEYCKLLLEKDGIYLEIQMELFFAEIDWKEYDGLGSLKNVAEARVKLCWVLCAC